MRQILSVLVENRTGVLARVAGMFARRGYNIESLTVSNTDVQEISRMTIVVDGDEKTIDQVTKQLHKLVEVLRISNITGEKYVARELIMLKLSPRDLNDRNEILQVTEIFRGKVLDICKESLVVELSGDSEKLAAFEEALSDYEVKEVVRSGMAAIARGSHSKLS